MKTQEDISTSSEIVKKTSKILICHTPKGSYMLQGNKASKAIYDEMTCSCGSDWDENGKCKGNCNGKDN